jgi:hypothetical protein
MRLLALAAPLALLAGMLACSQSPPSNPPTETAGPRPEPAAARCAAGQGDTMKDETITIREGTQPTLSGQLVGVADIWERDLPQVGSRMAAKVIITAPGERQGAQQFAYEGLELSIGSDRYCVTKVTEFEMTGGTKGPGSIALRKLP